MLLRISVSFFLFWLRFAFLHGLYYIYFMWLLDLNKICYSVELRKVYFYSLIFALAVNTSDAREMEYRYKREIVRKICVTSRFSRKFFGHKGRDLMETILNECGEFLGLQSYPLTWTSVKNSPTSFYALSWP